MLLRTAKSCGPDAPTQVLRMASRPYRVRTSQISADDGGKRARSPGRARHKLLKPLRAGMPGVSGVLVVTRVLFTNTKCTRGFCNGPRRVNPFLRHPLAGHLLLSGIGAGPSPDGVHERNRSANLRKA